MLGYIIWLTLIIGFFLPTILAKEHKISIFLCNISIGWTGIGWIALWGMVYTVNNAIQPKEIKTNLIKEINKTMGKTSLRYKID